MKPTNVYVSLLLSLLFLTLSIAESPLDDGNFQTAPVKTLHSTNHANMDLDTLERQRRVPRCGQFCRFRLCNFNGIETTILNPAAFSILDGPNSASLPYICSRRRQLGRVNTAGEARVFMGGNFMPISSFRPRGLDTPYSPRFIRPGNIPFLPFSGIARARAMGNQWDFLHDRCMIMPIRSVEVLNTTTMLPIRNMFSGRGSRNCVAFRTTAPTIQVQLVWDTADDFDVMLREPDGDVINFRNPTSEAGRLVNDNNVGFCSTGLTFGRENILYFPGGPIESGEYQVTVRHFNQCNRRIPTTWRLVVVVNGEVVVTRRGTSDRGDNRFVVRARFNFTTV